MCRRDDVGFERKDGVRHVSGWVGRSVGRSVCAAAEEGGRELLVWLIGLNVK